MYKCTSKSGNEAIGQLLRSMAIQEQRNRAGAITNKVNQWDT